MSAFIVDREDIDALADAIVELGICDVWHKDMVGRMLWRVNLNSVRYRYPDDKDGERPGPIGFRDEHTSTYTWTAPAVRPTGREIRKIAECYSYQSCEHPDWLESTAASWIGKLLAQDGDIRRALR